MTESKKIISVFHIRKRALTGRVADMTEMKQADVPVKELIFCVDLLMEYFGVTSRNS